jgi:hypothetical protein
MADRLGIRYGTVHGDRGCRWRQARCDARPASALPQPSPLPRLSRRRRRSAGPSRCARRSRSTSVDEVHGRTRTATSTRAREPLSLPFTLRNVTEVIRSSDLGPPVGARVVDQDGHRQLRRHLRHVNHSHPVNGDTVPRTKLAPSRQSRPGHRVYGLARCVCAGWKVNVPRPASQLIRRSRSGVRADPPTRRPRSELGDFARLSPSKFSAD